MNNIETFNFKKERFNDIRDYKFGRDWPVIYIIEGEKEAYIGETTSAFNRSKQHYDNPERKKLQRIHIIADEEYNKSATLDIESSLIQYMSADRKFLLQNGNKGLSNHGYYDREKYQAKFELLWEELKKMGLARRELLEIRNDDLFKYSPYKALTEDQLNVSDLLLFNLSKKEKTTNIISGKPGTGKTILAVYLVKRLIEDKNFKNLNIGLVIPMTSLRKTIKKVFRSIKGLRSDMVLGPSEIIRKKYDILLVDEAHRLRKRKNITNYKSFDDVNRKLGLDKKKGNELDWMILSSNHQIFFYDKNQTVKPSDVDRRDFKNIKDVTFYDLSSQLRVKGGNKYIECIEDFFDLRECKTEKKNDYEFKIYDNLGEMREAIYAKNKEKGLARMVAGYAWPWKTKNKNSQDYDIEIDGIKLVWNSVNTDWVNSKNSIKEVGCIHTVQGYDLNYAGVIIGPELSYSKHKKEFIIKEDKYMDINGKKGVKNKEELKKYIINIYKTLLTRGIEGTYVYIVDKSLRDFFKKQFSF